MAYLATRIYEAFPLGGSGRIPKGGLGIQNILRVWLGADTELTD
jgi:hypothetical protein